MLLLQRSSIFYFNNNILEGDDKMKGQVHLYTGNGKGKTTAAIGLAVRAIGADLKVFFSQFIKNGEYSEIKALKKIDNIDIRQYGEEAFINGKPDEADKASARKGLEEIKEAINSGEYQVVIIDEVAIAIFFELIDEEDLFEVINNRPENVEVILTGRMAKDSLIDKADLVTEMKEVKHYYQQGIMARTGIEK